MNSSKRNNVLNMYLGFALIRCGRTADIEMMVMKEEVNSHRSLKTRHSSPHRAMSEGTKVGQGAEETGKSRFQSLFGVFLGKEWLKQCR